MTTEGHARNAVRHLIAYAGDDPTREGLLETPNRVLRAYSEFFAGYGVDVSRLFTVFEDDKCDEMCLLTKCSFTSFCEHHILPFQGEAHVAYIPNGRVVGLSKLARVVDAYARRLQIQERLTEQITSAINEHLEPKGCACVIQAHHSCMSLRGVRKENATFVTSSLTGAFLMPEVRAEFFSLIPKG